MSVTLLSIVELGSLQDSDFAGDLEDSKSTSGWRGVLCIFGSRTCVSIRWMCKKCRQHTLLYAPFFNILVSSGGTSHCTWHFPPAHMCACSGLAKDVLCKHLHINLKSFCLVMFHRPLIDVPDFSPFCSTPPPPKTTSHSLMGTRQTTSATPRGGLLFGPLAEYTASQVMSPTPGSKSAVSTLRTTTPLMSTASTPRVTMPPQSQLPRTQRFPAASGSQQ